jgi:hypothetical protein
VVDERCDMPNRFLSVDWHRARLSYHRRVETTKSVVFHKISFHAPARDHDIAADPLLPHENKFLEGLSEFRYV